jgi:hypothetical protein
MISGAALLGALAPASVQAQNNARAVTTAFVESQLEFNDNYDLREDSLGNALLWTTTLGFGLNTFSDVDQLSLSARGSVRASDLPVEGSTLSADNPIVVIDYGRQVDDNSLGFNLRYNRADIAFFDPLSDIGPDGQFDDTRGDTGTRQSLRAGFDFALNEDGPVSLTGVGAINDITFTDTTDPDLQDRMLNNARVELGIAVSQTLRFTTGAAYALTDYASGTDNENDSTTWRGDVGMQARLNQRATMVGRIGYSEVTTQRNTGKEIESGIVGDLGFVVLEKRGETRASVGSIVDENGERYTVSVGKLVNWDNASLNTNLGLSTNEETELRFVGNIDYSLIGRRNQLTFGFAQTATTDDGDNVLFSNGRVSYSHLLTQQTTMNLLAVAGLERYENDSAPNVERLNMTASFNHSLTRDWSINAGYRYRQRNATDEDISQSNAVFFGVQRDFISSR